ncbi:MAG: glycosyltransferase family 4 protein [Bryobacteraceae bacterium]
MIEVSFLPIDPPLTRFLRRIKYARTIANFFVFNALLLIRLSRAQVVHVFTAAHSSYLLWTVPTILFGRLARKKVIVNYRDGRCEEHLKRSRLAKPTLRLAHAIVAPSDYLVDVLARFGLHARSIPNILDLSRFTYRERSPLPPVFLSNRGLEPLYNVACTLRAMALIQQRFPEASLIVAHDGPCRAELEQLARDLGLAHTQFIGTVDQKRLAELYREAGIYITTPNIDNMPGSLLECFASGLPLIATRAGGIPYIVRHLETGILVDLDDHRAVADWALRLLEDPELALRLARNGREEARLYAWQNIRPQWLALYAELVMR